MGTRKQISMEYLERVSHWRTTILVFLCWSYLATKIFFNPVFIILWPFLLTLGIALVRLFVWGRTVVYTGSLKDTDSLQKGDIILIGKQSVNEEWYLQLSNVLSHPVQDRFWTHVGIYEGNGKIWESTPHGVEEKDIWFYMHGGYIVRALRHRWITDPTVFDDMFAFCRQQKYNRRSFAFGGGVYYLLATATPIGFNYLFDNAFVDRLFKVENAYFCSEMVADAFKLINYPITPYDSWRVKPADFIGSPVLQEVRPLTPAELAERLGLE